MGIPNEKALYSEEDITHGERVYRPSSSRMKNFAKMLLNHAGEKIVNATPKASGDSLLAGIYNSMRGGAITTLNASRHDHGQEAFKNGIPGLKNIFQNFYSIYHLKDGITKIDSIYTREFGGREYLLAIQPDNEQISVTDLQNEAADTAGNEENLHRRIRDEVGKRKYADMNPINAGVYKELTDGGIYDKKVLDLSALTSQYSIAELWFFGKKGNKTTVAPGIYKYERPSKADFFKFYGKMDLFYSAMGLTAKGAEKVLSDQAAQDIFKSEVGGSIMRTQKRYGGVHPYM